MSHEHEASSSDTDLECPACAATVGYDETVILDDQTTMGCPHCGSATPVDDWFA